MAFAWPYAWLMPGSCVPTVRHFAVIKSTYPIPSPCPCACQFYGLSASIFSILANTKQQNKAITPTLHPALHSTKAANYTRSSHHVRDTTLVYQ